LGNPIAENYSRPTGLFIMFSVGNLQLAAGNFYFLPQCQFYYFVDPPCMLHQLLGIFWPCGLRPLFRLKTQRPLLSLRLGRCVGCVHCVSYVFVAFVALQLEATRSTRCRDVNTTDRLYTFYLFFYSITIFFLLYMPNIVHVKGPTIFLLSFKQGCAFLV